MRFLCGAIAVTLLSYILFAGVGAAATMPSKASGFVGRPVSEALRALSGTNLQFVFSSALVPDSLLVTPAKSSTSGRDDPLNLARSILAPHGLSLSQIQPGLYAVIADPAASRITASDARGRVPRASAEESTAFSELVISTSRYRIGETASSPFEVRRDEIENQPVLGDDPVRALGRIPGVVQDGLTAQANVRGGETGEVLMLLDGYPLRRAFHLSGYQSLFSLLNTGIVRGAEIYTGGFPARYGNRMAGVFDFHSVVASDEPHHSLGIDFFNASARSSGTFSRREIDYLAAARVGTLSPLLRAFAPDVGDPRYLDSYLKIEHGDPQVLRVSGNWLWARNELTISDRDTGEQADFEDRLQYLWLRLDREFSPTLDLHAWIGQSSLQSFRFGTVDEPAIQVGSIRDRRTSLIWDFRALGRWRPAGNHAFEFGGEFTREHGRYLYGSDVRYSRAAQSLFAIEAQTQRRTDLSLRRQRSALFASHRWQLLPTVATELGIRGQGLSSSGLRADWSIEPRIGIRWDLPRRTRFNLSWGRFRQADEVHELQVEDGLENFPTPQVSDHFIAGLEHQWSPELKLRAEFFSKRQSDPRARFENLLNRRTLLPEIAPDRVRVLPDSAELEGIEVFGELSRDEWVVWLSLGWLRAFDRTLDEEVPRNWDPSWSIDTGARWRRGPWSLSARAYAHRGFPATSIVSSVAGPVLGTRNDSRVATFFSLDVRAQFTQALSLGTLDYSVELLNSTAQRNPCCTELVSTPSGLAGRTLEGLPLVPSLGLRWNW